MDEIIERIIKIENEAQELLKEAKEEKEKLSKTIDLEIKRLEKETKERTETKKTELKNFEDDEAEEKITAINKKLEESLEKLSKTALLKKEKWVEDLVNSVIK